VCSSLRRANKIVLAALGFGLIVIGVILLIIGLLGFNQVYNCPANGCGPEVESMIFRARVSFYSGIVLIAAGILLLFATWRLKP
jgi:hypothetical protein